MVAEVVKGHPDVDAVDPVVQAVSSPNLSHAAVDSPVIAPIVAETIERFGEATSAAAGSVADLPDARASADRHPQTASVTEALEQRAHPERLSALVAARPFDRAAYEANPEAYLAISEPGRIWGSAQPEEGVEPLQVLGHRSFVVNQGDVVPLIVRTDPGMPVTFTSFDLGRFQENGLTSITVPANELGYAQADFEAIQGTWNQVRILASSPVRSGQITFTVRVQVPGLTQLTTPPAEASR
ncbi:MAG: hypothetical protein EA402_13885 [Planctomycetota bacterium]|nr:MAG: hypothetical protein EA402_13885 [Planctomycetota bacterium]